MPRPRKYQKGGLIEDVEVLVGLILGRFYVFIGDKPTHPSWLGSQSLFTLQGYVRMRRAFFAFPADLPCFQNNPTHDEGDDCA